MKIELAPTLQIQRELYEKPRDMARFKWYVAQMTGGNEADDRDVVVPIAAVNPMGKPHCLVAVNALIALDAEAIAERAACETKQRLAFVDASARLCINLLDDAMGGWTNRYFTEAKFLMSSEYEQRSNKDRQFVVVGVWSSEAYTAARIRQETLMALYRYAWFQQHGLPTTLKEIMRMNGYAGKFANATEPTLPDDDLAYTREVIQPHLNSTDLAINLAFLFGDAAARECGYAPMGLSARAGLALALDEARNSDESPVEALRK